MSLNFPADPSNGDTYEGYVYDASITAWKRDIFGSNRFLVSATTPVSAISGDLWFDSSELLLYAYYVDEDSSQWVQVVGERGFGIPLGGATGQVLAKISESDYAVDWADAASSIANLTDVDLDGLVDGNSLIYDSASGKWIPGEGGGGASFSISETAPEEAESGDVWFNSTSGKTYIYYEDEDSAQWVEIASNTVGYLDIGQLNDVSIVSPENGEVLKYDSTTSKWINDTIEEPNYASDQAVLASQIFG
jgi:hypothetical protein